jgi:hypothetical protein
LALLLPAGKQLLVTDGQECLAEIIHIAEQNE